jgi:hypothetical protein
MPESLHEIFKRKVVPIRFERTMGLVGATTLGIGALMGAGIYVLIGLAADEAGPAAWLSYLICVQCAWESMRLSHGMAPGPGQHICLRHVCDGLCLLRHLQLGP